MRTDVVKLEPQAVTDPAVRRAADVLGDGGVVVFPTETVYGVAARADNAEAIRRLRLIKSRDGEKAFTVHLGDRDDAGEFTNELSPMARRIVRRAWPGPLTIVLAVPDPLAAPVMAGRNGSARDAMFFNGTVGLRCPDHAIALEVLRGAGGPVVASSANLAGRAAPLDGPEALRDMDGLVDLVVDAGPTRYAKASTVVRVERDRFEVLREGVLDAGMIQRMSKVRILFVCSGNTCRSPMAEALAKSILAERLGCGINELPDKGAIVQSAGTGGGIGGATPEAVAAMRRRGLDLEDHVSTPLSAEMLHAADHVYAMTQGHLRRITELAPSAADRASLLLRDQDLNDPIGGSQEEYERCAQSIERALRERLQEVSL